MSTLFNPVRGMRDFSVLETRKRSYILRKIEETVNLNGFNSIKTPAVESKEFLKKGNEESENSKLGFSVSTGDCETSSIMGLRYDLTVPLARFYSANKNEITLPFRSYQTGDVYRAERPQKGRYREFTQCDIDVLGDQTSISEIDVVSTALKVFEMLSINDVVFIINDKQMLYRILSSLGFIEKDFSFIFRELDKLSKTSIEEVENNLLSVCDKNTVSQLIILIENISKCETNQEALQFIRAWVGNSYITDLVEFFGERILVNPFLTRGMDYYTGVVFECVSSREKLSVAAGGRYDNFKDTIPAVGLSFGFERIIPLVDVSEKENLDLILIYDKAMSIDQIFEAKQKMLEEGFLVRIQPKPKNMTSFLNESSKFYNYFTVLKPGVEIEVKRLR